MSLYRVGIPAVVFVCAIALSLVSAVQAQIVFDFESGGLDDWEVISDIDLGDVGPPTWEVRNSQLGLDGKALYQGSNIWGDATDSCLMGTFIIYKGEQFSNFTIDVDVAAADNDGMGLVWAYADTSKHYRAIIINDRWPDVSVDGVEGPFMKIAKRVSDDNPWYELLEVVKDDYKPYPQGPKLHWTLEVHEGSFSFTREDELNITAEDKDYESGFVGIQLYAQQAEFDNFIITPGAAVEPADKMATAWGTIKNHHGR